MKDSKDWICLAQLPLGGRLTVTQIMGEENMRCRLADLGMVEHTEVACLMVSPLGDPRAYSVRGAVIALRRRDAENVWGVPAEEERVP